MKTNIPNRISAKTSYMNNAKWLKFIEIFEAQNFRETKIKFLSEDKIYPFHNFGVVEDTYCDCMTGAFHYKEIEWIFIPKQYEIERFNRTEKLASSYRENPIEQFVQSLEQKGKFFFEIDKKGITIFGYK